MAPTKQVSNVDAILKKAGLAGAIIARKRRLSATEPENDTARGQHKPKGAVDPLLTTWQMHQAYEKPETRRQ